MPRGEIVISEALCKGCELCVDFCNRGCITLPEGKLTSRGTPLVDFTYPEKCNACGICGWMCPDFAIDVYKYVEAKTPSA